MYQLWGWVPQIKPMGLAKNQGNKKVKDQLITYIALRLPCIGAQDTGRGLPTVYLRSGQGGLSTDMDIGGNNISGCLYHLL